MKKKQSKRKFRTVIGITKPSTDEPRKYSAEWTALQAKRAMDYLAPLIKAQHIDPVQALILTAAQMDYTITGKQRGIGEDEIQKICFMILAAWKEGMFAPSATYPHTLQKTLEAWEALPKANDDGSEDEEND